MFKIYNNAGKLPRAWDDLAGDNPFIKIDSLKKLEQLNPCRQLYHFALEKKIILVTYRLRIDLFTFSKYLSLKIPVNIIGVPMSVSKCGYAVGDQRNKDVFVNYVQSLKGFHLILNSEDNLAMTRGDTLPTCKMRIRWSTFNEYFLSTRSHYRYRVRKALEKFSDIKVEELKDNKLFDEKMYNLYLNVYQNSNEKLEKLSIDFFRNYPSRIFTFMATEEVIAFIQLMEDNEELIFLFGGFCHSLNLTYDLYMNMLLYVINYAIDNGYKRIDLGQTAEETKLKLGAFQQPKYMYLNHSNPVINVLIDRLADKFSYRQYGTVHTVFKEENNESPAG